MVISRLTFQAVVRDPGSVLVRVVCTFLPLTERGLACFLLDISARRFLDLVGWSSCFQLDMRADADLAPVAMRQSGSDGGSVRQRAAGSEFSGSEAPPLLAATCGTSADNFLSVFRRSPLRCAASVCLFLSSRARPAFSLVPLRLLFSARAAGTSRQPRAAAAFTRSWRAKRNAAVQVTANGAAASASRPRAPGGGFRCIGNYFGLLLISFLLQQSGTEPTSLPGWIQIF